MRSRTVLVYSPSCAKINHTKDLPLLLISALSYFKAICTGQPACANGGTCISPERCRCMPGWRGAKCRTGKYDTACKATSLRASSPIWASETSLARMRERAAKPRGAEERFSFPRPLARAFSRGSLRLPK